MTVEEWKKTVIDIASLAEKNGSEPSEARDLLFGLWRVFMAAPSVVHAEFESISDKVLEVGAETSSTSICQQISLDFSSFTELRELTLNAAFLLRALEAIFLQAEGGRFPRTIDELRVKYGGHEGFLIPFSPRFRVAKEWPTYFQKKGLRASRCIPAKLDSGVSVDLQLSDQFVNVDELNCTAQFFNASEPLDSHGAPIDFSAVDRFVFHGLSDVVDPEIQSRIEDVCKAEPRCDVLVFPELTMPPERLRKLRDVLEKQPWNDNFALKPPVFVLGGSWHHLRPDGKYENRAPLLDGYGRLIGEHKKTIPYQVTNLVEDIQSSNSVLVVASTKIVVAIGICLDFCQVGRPSNFYDDLDVDLIIVPSMGHETTLDAHKVKATQYWASRKTATFVSQQHGEEDFGYIASMPFPKDSEFGQRIQGKTASRKFDRKG